MTDEAVDYGRVFARVYDLRWGGFAERVAPELIRFYRSKPVADRNLDVLDLGCGTGHLAEALLDAGFRVTGLDRSRAMLDVARERLAPHLESGRATLIEADTAAFELERRFGLVVSTYDTLNHLPDPDALESCARCARAVTADGGWFVFDLNTRRGLIRWRGIWVEDDEEVFRVTRGLYDPGDSHAVTRITGFLRGEDGRYDRFDERIGNTAFALEDVLARLRAAGWTACHAARLDALGEAVADPEQLGRAFLVARG
jgi:SAM-dependent methyltransferase